MLLTLVISILIGLVAIPKIVIIAKHNRLFDKPSDRKVHKGTTPRLGGLSFYPTAALSFSVAYGVCFYLGCSYASEQLSGFMAELFLFNASCIMLFMVGVADDLKGVDYKRKFIVQTLAAISITISGVGLVSAYGLFGINELANPLSSIITVIFIVFTINAFNLIDGVDGLCSGISNIILTTYGVWFLYVGDIAASMISFAMVGVVATFFKYNVTGKRMKIFMGDTGSLTLGLIIAFLSLHFLQIDYSTIPDKIAIENPLAIVIGLLFIPLFDTTRVFAIRILDGHSPFHPDKRHIHHMLLALGCCHIKSTIILLFSTVMMCALNVLLSQILELNINIVFAIDIAIALSLYYYMYRGIRNNSRAAARIRKSK